MAHRTQIMISDHQYRVLRDESERSGMSLAELVRRALARSYGEVSLSERLATLDRSFGGWEERPGEERSHFLRQMRPGLDQRLSRDEERYAELERLAARAGRSAASILREAIDDKLRGEAGAAHRREAVDGLLSAPPPGYGAEPDWADVKDELRAGGAAA